MSQVQAVVTQIGPSTCQATVRTHSVVVDRPTPKGGEDRGAMGGEYLLIALGGCFMSNLLAAARARQATVANARITVTGTLDGTPERFTAFTLNVSAVCNEADLLPKLVSIAERSCIVSNTLREVGPISISVDRSSGETVNA